MRFRAITFLTDFMQTRLQTMKRRIAPASSDQLVMRTVLDHPAALDRDQPVGAAHRRETMGDDEDGAAARDLLHVLLNDALAFIVEGAGRLVEDQDARVVDERAGDRD